ncbi:MAG: rhamnulokinase [Erysipelotrichaceae bacterium]|nr:rhamnulokinase [Erysipelotrichaceae bacterium]
MKYYLAIDIGASSGRHLISYFKDGKICQKEVYRFKNEIIEKNDSYYWDINKLFFNVLEGLKQCKTQNYIPCCIGIDTWAVDYVLLDKNEELVRDVFSYRDKRTENIIEEVHRKISFEKLYKKTGIQFQNFNSFYQLFSESEYVKEKSCHFLMIPDYLNYKLTNVMKNEYTNFTSTQLLNLESGKVDEELKNIIGFKEDIFKEIIMPKQLIGTITEEIKDYVGFDAEVISVASHDTASAFISRIKEDSIILSSGTWSLIGITSDVPIISEEALNANFTNEGGFNKEYRFLKNVSGLWLIQEVSRNLDYKYSYGELAKFAYESNYNEIFDVTNEMFLKPKNMIDTINTYFVNKGKNPPKNIKDISRTVFRSLANSYKTAIEEIEKISNKKYKYINIMGGGSQNQFLNYEIEKVTNKKVILNPIEATSLGNIAVQMLYSNEINNLKEYRKYLKEIV